MTLDELKELQTLIKFAKGKVFTDSLYNLVKNCENIVEREIKLKTTDYVKY